MPASLLCPQDFQARILEWVAISSSRGSSWPRDQTQVSCIKVVREAHRIPLNVWKIHEQRLKFLFGLCIFQCNTIVGLVSSGQGFLNRHDQEIIPSFQFQFRNIPTFPFCRWETWVTGRGYYLPNVKRHLKAGFPDSSSIHAEASSFVPQSLCL